MRAHRLVVPVLLVIVASCLGHDLYYLLAGLFNPPITWRETQTAISAYWLWREGPRLAYETPVLGYPWAIPFEFPLYQGIVAALRAVGVPLEAGGRLVSFAFYIATLAPLWILLKELRLHCTTFLVIAILFLASPIYALIAASVFVETSALFFSVTWLAFLARYLNRLSITDLVIATIAGALACLAKATTFPAYGILGAALIVSNAVSGWRAGRVLQWKSLSLAALAGILPLVVGYAWVAYTDHIKLLNPFAANITSSALTTWNFGTLEQRLSAKFWVDVVMSRAIPDILGNGFVLAFLAAGSCLPNYRRGAYMAAAGVAFLLPLLTFTNLYLVHPYYVAANGLLCLATAGLGISYVAERGRIFIAGTLLAGILVGQLITFHKHYVPLIMADLRENVLVRTATLVRQMSDPDSAILIFGQDWMPAISFLSERRSLTVPAWTAGDTLQRLVQDPGSLLGGKKLGAIVSCAEPGYTLPQAIKDFLANRPIVADAGQCKLLGLTPRQSHN